MKRSRRSRRGLAVGLTGGIACGKSEVGRLLAGLGADILDADDVAHELIRKNGPLFRRVVARFGREVVGRDGEIDRAALGRRVFADAAERQALEAMIHPAVIRRMKTWAQTSVKSGRVAVGIVPLLFEVGMTKPWDAIVCVTAPADTVVRRLAKRGLTPAEARRRMRAQMPVRQKCAKSDFVIRNDGPLRGLKTQTLRIWRELLKKERAS